MIGYGGNRLAERGLDSKLNIDLLFDKGFYTFRKSKLWDETYAGNRYHPTNLFNKHFTRNVHDAMHVANESDIPH